MNSPADNYVTNLLTAVSLVGVVGMLFRLGTITVYAMLGTFFLVSILTLIAELRRLK